jgi:NAD(P)-dependent dehydrogenase (short-subunit alcohol dehydrogenase family)
VASDPFSVRGRRTVVTGGTAGIGMGVAEHFVQAGAAVVITGRRPTGKAIAAGIGAAFVPMDVSDDDSVRDGFERAGDALGGGIDVLILNAGVDLDTGPIEALDLAAFRRVVDVNLVGVARGFRFGLAHMERGGAVIVTSSPAGRLTAPRMGAYSASKAGVDLLTRSAALELGPRGIRVNAVLPGIVESEMTGGATSDGEWIVTLTASGLMRQPREIGGVFQFLASDAGSVLTGATIEADDGISAGLSAGLLGSAFGEN